MRTAVPASLLFAFLLLVSPVDVSLAQGGVEMTQLSGRWASTEHVTFTNPTLAGSSFFLDIAIAEDGTFQGTWDAYSCVSYPGAYSTMIISCSRTKRPEKARGKFNLAARGGEIVLDKLGRASFTYSLGTELLLNLPEDWLKQGDPVLYKSKLARASK
jgi:pentatricopeptide repeat protein